MLPTMRQGQRNVTQCNVTECMQPLQKNVSLKMQFTFKVMKNMQLIFKIQ